MARGLDGNGIIDDVDKGKDGICDCLKIATLGVKGKYGSGDIFANWLAARSDFGAVPLGVQVLTPALLADYELIVAQDVSAKGFFGGGYQAAEVAALQAWVESGGGLMTLIGYEDEYSVNNVNKLLQPFGLSYGSQKILSKGSSSSTVSVTSWMPHAVTQGVSSIGVDNGYEPKGTGSVLATQSGYSMLRVHTAGTGKIALWGDEWITYDSEWTLHPEYQVELFWLNLIKWLSPDNRCQVPIPPGIK